MDIKTLVSFNVVKDDIEFVFSMPATAGLGIAYDAAHDVLQKIANEATKLAEKNKRETEDAPKKEVKK